MNLHVTGLLDFWPDKLISCVLYHETFNNEQMKWEKQADLYQCCQANTSLS